MTGWLGVGNEQVYPGRDGWLFYRPDVEYLTGRGFLEPAALARRSRSAASGPRAIEPDPREAIAQLKSELDARGIALIVMPIPVKPTIHPGSSLPLTRDRATPLRESVVRSAASRISAGAGLLVLDVSASLANARRQRTQYLATDTHWRPESMEWVAEALTAFIATPRLAARRARPRLPRGARRGAVDRRHRADAGSARRSDVVSDRIGLAPAGARRATASPGGRPAKQTCWCWATASATFFRSHPWGGATRPALSSN